jgi:hypothetical protein
MEKAGYPPDATADNFERIEELPPDAPDADFHLLDQPVSFARREFHSRPVRHHRASSPAAPES